MRVGFARMGACIEKVRNRTMHSQAGDGAHDSQLCFEGARSVVYAGVYDAAIMALSMCSGRLSGCRWKGNPIKIA